MLQQTVGFDLPLVGGLTAATALPVKFMVDVVKNAFPCITRAFLPLVGIGIGFVFCLLFLVATQTHLYLHIAAECLIASIGAQLAAMATTTNQTHADKVDEKITAALKMDSTASLEDVNKVVRDAQNKV